VSLTFTKLFSSITESTIWLEPMPTRIVWIAMLAMADRNGFVFGSVPGLAHRARVSVDECRAALRTLLEPDPDSRTKDHEGRRIAEIDGGWELLNYAKYRAILDAESVKASKRECARRRRGRQPLSTVDECRHVMSTHVYVDSGRHSPSASASASDLSLLDPDPSDPPDPDLPDQVGSPRASEPTLEVLSAVIREIPAEIELDDELRAEAVAAGCDPAKLDERWRKLKSGPIGGRRGVFQHKLRDYIRGQFGLWKTWDESERAQARASPRRRGSREHHQPDAGVDPWAKAKIL
jgi:hypothetical protein